MRFILILIAFPFLAIGADTSNVKQLNAVRIEQPPKIDGKLDEDIWKQAPAATDFIQNAPNPGEKSTQRTEVRVLYDNTAIYVGATMFDVSADSILRELTNRDNEGNACMFTVFIDTYDDDQNAFAFGALATGVQLDIRYSSSGQDFSWDAVWKSEVTIDDSNWHVEMKIPYSALRFPDSKKQKWGINFCRRIRRIREFSFWNYLNPEVEGMVNQFGQLNGIENIESPVRLSVVPYVSGYIENYSDDDGNSNSYSLRGGLDLKYGISDAFTLDMTLIPDFGQVQSDNEVLNLSPFETRYMERRPFFMEGTELFNKGGLFYSRRIGKRPTGYYDVENLLGDGESIKENPTEAQLINSTKLSGRTQKGLGIGLLNAVTAASHATIENSGGETRKVETEPLSNYNVFVLDKSMKNNSYLSFVNTNVMREGSAYDANVSGALFKIVNKKNTLSANGNGVLSQKYFHSADSVGLGYKYNIELRKIGGNWQYGAWHQVESDTYDPNDLGFLNRNNKQKTGAYLNYNIYKPFWKLLNLYNSLNVNYSRLYLPNEFSDFAIFTNTWATFKNWLTLGVWTRFEPVLTYDFFEPREPGRYYTYPTSYNVGGFFSSDYRKTFALDGGGNYRRFDESGRYTFNYNIEPRLRLSDHMMLVYEFEAMNFFNDVGFATNDNDDIIFGKRDYIIYENTLDARYIFTNRMGVSLRLRHNWSRANYSSFHLLRDDGYLDATAYTGIDSLGTPIHNVNFNAFNIDLVYTWVFAPGSEINIVWKQAILNSDGQIVNDYFSNLKNTFALPQTNSISIKVLYYLDYLSLKKSS